MPKIRDNLLLLKDNQVKIILIKEGFDSITDKMISLSLRENNKTKMFLPILSKILPILRLGV